MKWSVKLSVMQLALWSAMQLVEEWSAMKLAVLSELLLVEEWSAIQLDVASGLPVVEVEDIEDGGGLRVKFERPLTQTECFDFIRGLSFEDVLNGPVTDDQTEFRVWWD